MKFFDRVRAVFNEDSFQRLVSDWLAGKDTDIPTTGDIAVNENSALKYSVFFSCLRVLAETFASVPIKEYRKTKEGRDETDETGWLDILHSKANDEMSAHSFHEAMMYQLNLGGNVVCEKLLTRGGDPYGLYPQEWSNVKIVRNEYTKQLEYIIGPSTEQVTKSRNQIFHVPGPSLNGVTGLSVLEYAVASIRLGLTYERFNQKFYRNSATPSGVFEHPGNLKDTAYDRLKKQLAENYQGLTNAGRPILAEDGLKFNPLSIKPVDAELLSSKVFQIGDVCRFTRVPPHMVAELSRSTNNNIEHQSLEFVMYTMLPHYKRFEGGINTWLLTKEQRKAGYYFEYNMAGLLRGDAKSMAEAFAIGRQWGWLSVNDIRRMLNMNSIGPSGDIYLQPLNMIEAGTQAVEDQYKNIVDSIYKLIETGKK